MGIVIKTNEQIGVMRRAGRITALTHEHLANYIRPGITTGDISKIAEDFIRSYDGSPSFLGYRGFPAAVCTSVNSEVIHGIPGKYKLKNGDIIGIDIGVCYKRYHCDAARTHAVGKITAKHKTLIEATQACFFRGMEFARAKGRLHDISDALENYIDEYGFSMVREWCGHGIGRQLHEDPQIPHTRQEKRGPRLEAGMTLAIEPMVNAGTNKLNIKNDTWTVVTQDGEYSAHYENTVLITDGEPEILTL